MGLAKRRSGGKSWGTKKGRLNFIKIAREGQGKKKPD